RVRLGASAVAARHRYDVGALALTGAVEDRVVDPGSREQAPADRLAHRPVASRRRRESVSSVTASRRMTPVVISFVAGLYPTRSIPFEIIAIMSAPSRALRTAPRPPNRLVPPMTAAEIAFSSVSPPPDARFTPFTRAAKKM